ncbi:MAG: CoA transferase [Calditrichaeota bacterium]|nr:CoA transferase [Calditrichota bacterium]
MPLRDLKILDVSRLLPGPYAAMILAEFGARVIKIEDPAGGEPLRATTPKLQGESIYFSALNRGKRSLTLNLKSEEGRAIFRRLVASSDVLVEGFRPGVMKKLGLDFDSLKETNPRLIYCAITGYGQSGSDAGRAGHDLNYLAKSGLLDFLQKDGQPIVPGFQLTDIVGGTLQALVGILLALIQREKTGLGQMVDVSMADGALLFLPLILAEFGLPHLPPNPVGGFFACYSLYPTRDGRTLSVACYERKFWEGFCRALGHEKWISLQFNPDPAVQENLKTQISKIIASKPLAHWVDIFTPLNICVEPVQSLDEVVDDPHFRERGDLFRENGIFNLHFPLHGSQLKKHPGIRPPKLGEHTEEILGELGFSSEEVRKLKETGVV